MAVSSWQDSSPSWMAVARAYAELERDLRAVIDRVTRRVCPSCTRSCCRVHYCRATALNPWYRYVSRGAGGATPPAGWETRRDPYGLGSSGCEIRAGRYVFCYSYNCPDLERFARKAGVADEFQEISDLLLPVNRLPRRRWLHESGAPETLGEEDRVHMEDALAAARRRLGRLQEVILRRLASFLHDGADTSARARSAG